MSDMWLLGVVELGLVVDANEASARLPSLLKKWDVVRLYLIEVWWANEVKVNLIRDFFVNDESWLEEMKDCDRRKSLGGGSSSPP